MSANLIRKYNIPGPRYTSYPTVPFWEDHPDQHSWRSHVSGAFESSSQDGISIYIHLPYCERLCTYCGCNTRISVNHAVEKPYIDALLTEWQRYLGLFSSPPLIREIHLGGGTPTFFSPANLDRLIDSILKNTKQTPDSSFGFEAHPGNTTREHLKTLHGLGFRRLSLGVQDFDSKVQEIVNRKQTFEQVKEVTDAAREAGYDSINFDLIYGLPYQKEKSITDTVGKVRKLQPDRIAFYSYAHVPWIKPGQRRFTEMDLPTDEAKRKLYELGRDLLTDAGYYEIGMDHFALPTDELYKAAQQKTLHRNFMGYTPFYTRLMIGLGVSSISDTWTAFAQNHKTVEEYVQHVNSGFPIFRGHILNGEDLVVRKHILNLMCHYQTSWEDSDQWIAQPLGRLEEMLADGLISIGKNTISITSKGRPFLRNICMAFDLRLWRKQPKKQIFSTTI